MFRCFPSPSMTLALLMLVVCSVSADMSVFNYTLGGDDDDDNYKGGGEGGNFCGGRAYHCGKGDWQCCGPQARICCGPGPDFVCCYGNTACCFQSGGEDAKTMSWLIWAFSAAVAFIILSCCCVFCCVCMRRKRGGGIGGGGDGGDTTTYQPPSGSHSQVPPNQPYGSVNHDAPEFNKEHTGDGGDDMRPKRLALPAPDAPPPPYNDGGHAPLYPQNLSEQEPLLNRQMNFYR